MATRRRGARAATSCWRTCGATATAPAPGRSTPTSARSAASSATTSSAPCTRSATRSGTADVRPLDRFRSIKVKLVHRHRRVRSSSAPWSASSATAPASSVWIRPFISIVDRAAVRVPVRTGHHLAAPRDGGGVQGDGRRRLLAHRSRSPRATRSVISPAPSTRCAPSSPRSTVSDAALIANVSHELRTPLTASAGAVREHRRRGPGERRRERRGIARRDRTSERAGRGVLDLSRLESGASPLQLGTLRRGDAARRRRVERGARRPGRPDHRADDRPLTYVGDRARLHQVVLQPGRQRPAVQPRGQPGAWSMRPRSTAASH